MSQTITDTARYSFHVTWSPEDAEFIATCVEFPSLSWLAGTPEKALTGLRIVVDEVVDDMRANDEPVPEPLSTRPLLREVPTPTWRGPASTTRDRGCGAAPQLEPVRHAQTGRLLNVRSVTRPERNSRASRSHFSRWLRRQDGDPTYYPRFNFTDR